MLVPYGGDLWWFWEPLAFCFPGVQEGVSSPFSSGINFFLLVCVINAGKGSYPPGNWRVTWTERGCSVWSVMSPRQQNKVPDSETGGCWGADRKARVTTDSTFMSVISRLMEE